MKQALQELKTVIVRTDQIEEKYLDGDGVEGF